MKADHDAATAGCEQIRERREHRRELVQLLVDRDSQRLKGPCGGMDLRHPLLRGWDRTRRDSGEVRRGVELVRTHRLLDQPRDLARIALLTELADHLAERIGIELLDQLERSLPAARIHAHVERTLLHEREAALGAVELRRRHAEIENDSIDLRHVELAE